METLINPTGLPTYIHRLGISDTSLRKEIPVKLSAPLHTPKFYFLGDMGTYEPMLVNKNRFYKLYGKEPFNQRNKFYNVGTAFIEGVLGTLSEESGSAVVQRLEVAGATTAGVELWIDIAKRNDLPQYRRTSSGELVTPLVTVKTVGSTPVDEALRGYHVRYYVKPSTGSSTTTEAGLLENNAGASWATLTAPTSSTAYRLVTFKGKYNGSGYNNYGVSLNAYDKRNLDSILFKTGKQFAYSFKIFEKTTEKDMPFKTVDGDVNAKFVLANNFTHPKYNTHLSLDHVMEEKWENTTNTGKPTQYPIFDEPIIEYANIQAVSKLFMEAEKNFLNSIPTGATAGSAIRRNITTTSTPAATDGVVNGSYASIIDVDQNADINTDYGMFNTLSHTNSIGVRYFTVMAPSTMVTAAAGTENVENMNSIPFFLRGGSDGTIVEGSNGSLSGSTYDDLCRAEFVKYGDENSKYQNTAINLETHFYDVGFSITTKEAMKNIISHRKDTIVVLSTHTHNKTIRVSASDNSLYDDANTLAANINMTYADVMESQHFYTPTARYLIVVGSCRVIDSMFMYRVPATYEVLMKYQRYMGGNQRLWRDNYSLNGYPKNRVEFVKDLKPTVSTLSMDVRSWESNLTWFTDKSPDEKQLVNIQTGYNADESVLNSYEALCAAVVISKIHDDVQRTYSNRKDLTKSALKRAVEEELSYRTKGLFIGIGLDFEVSVGLGDTPVWQWQTKTIISATTGFGSMISIIETRQLS